MQITSQHSLNAFLLPIKTVGVQVSSGRGSPPWNVLLLAFTKFNLEFLWEFKCEIIFQV